MSPQNKTYFISAIFSISGPVHFQPRSDIIQVLVRNMKNKMHINNLITYDILKIPIKILVNKKKTKVVF